MKISKIAEEIYKEALKLSQDYETVLREMFGDNFKAWARRHKYYTLNHTQKQKQLKNTIEFYQKKIGDFKELKKVQNQLNFELKALSRQLVKLISGHEPLDERTTDKITDLNFDIENNAKELNEIIQKTNKALAKLGPISNSYKRSNGLVN